MPTYEYRCKDCETEFTSMRKISERAEPIECPNCKSMNSEQFIGTAPTLADPVRIGVKKPDDGFKDVLRKIHEKTPGSKLKENSRYI